MKIFLSAGEASGDAYAARLVTEIRRLSQALPAQQLEQMIWEVAKEEGISRLKEFIDPNASITDTWDFGSEDIEFIMALEDKFKIKIPDDEISTWKVNNDIVQTVKRLHVSEDNPSPFMFSGVGGQKSKIAGVKLVADSSRWGAISIVQALRTVPKVFTGYYSAKASLSTKSPGLFIPIDFGYANIRLARHAKNKGWKVLYFVPPGSWRRDRQGADLPQIADKIVTPFEWSAEILNKIGADAYWFGHPIKQLVEGAKCNPEVKTTIAVLPGSRKHEIEANLPVLAEALRSIDRKCVFALAPTEVESEFRETWNRLSGRNDDSFVVGDTGFVLRGARAAVVCSGTATLEAALCECPMVVVYRLTEGMQREAKLLNIKRPKFIALPNIILDRPSIPELVQEEASPEKIRQLIENLLQDGQEREHQLSDFHELDSLLGPSDAITKTAELALDMLTDIAKSGCENQCQTS